MIPWLHPTGTNILAEFLLFGDGTVKLLISFGRPDLTALRNLFLPMLLQLFLHQVLEIEHGSFTFGMKRPMDEHARIEVLLNSVTQVIVLQLDTFEKVCCSLEYIVWRGWIAKDLILGDDGGSTGGKHACYKKVGRRQIHCCIWKDVSEGAAAEE